MTLGSNSGDERLHEFVSLPAASGAGAVAGTHDGDDDIEGDRELDQEVSRFLETEFCAHVYHHNGTSDSNDSFAAFRPMVQNAFRKDELLFLDDISDAIDMPDLDFDDAGALTSTTLSQAFDSVRTSADASTEVNSSDSASVSANTSAVVVDATVAASVATSTRSLAASHSSIAQVATPSAPLLRVIIPASALATRSPPLRQLKPSASASATASTLSSSLRQQLQTHHQLPPLPRSVSGGRKRAKFELEYLRQQVQELERNLEQLKETQSSSCSGGGDTSPSTSSLAALHLSESMCETTSENWIGEDDTRSQTGLWQRIAEHQHGEKQKAELENTKLKEMLERQLKIARSLSRVLHKRQDLSVRVCR